MEQRPTPDLERLLAQAGWVRSLASRLVADAHGAEDVVQETWSLQRQAIALCESSPSK